MRGRGAEEKKKWGRPKEKTTEGMDAQVLLLRDPGAELGWAELSDTLPSAGGREGTHGHTNRTRLTTRRNQESFKGINKPLLSTGWD